MYEDDDDENWKFSVGTDLEGDDDIETIDLRDVLTDKEYEAYVENTGDDGVEPEVYRQRESLFADLPVGGGGERYVINGISTGKVLIFSGVALIGMGVLFELLDRAR